MPGHFYEFDSFRVDTTERQLWQNGRLVPMTPKVFDVLLILLENKGQTVEKEQLIKQVWTDTYVEDGSINRNISTLRKALGDDSNEQRFIKTLPKRGYRFTDKVKEIVVDNTPEIDKDVSSTVKKETPSSPFLQNRTKILMVFVSILVFGLIAAWTMVGRNPKNNADLAGLTENERRQLVKGGSARTEANEDYVKGRTLWHQRSAEGLHLSIIHLEHAVKTDPNFALAHSALADAYAFDAAKKELAKPHAEEAIRLDPALGEPYASIGFVQMFWEWKLSDANASLRKAVELSPDYATAHQWYAINLVASRFGGAALAEMKRALELEPHSVAIGADLCQMYYFLQKYDDAVAQCRKTLETDPNFLNAHLYLYEIYTAKGMYNEAVAEFFKIEQLKSDFGLPVEESEKLRRAYAQGGIREFWNARVEFLERNPHAYKLAQYSARRGENDKAIEWLQRSYTNRDFDFVLFLTDPVFTSLTSEPQFIELAHAFNRY